MDRNDPPIIKSGARHSVQIAQGSRNAKSVRNVVTSDVDAPLEDRVVQESDAPERATAVLQQAVTQELQLGQKPQDGLTVLESEPSASSQLVAEPDAAAAGGQGVVSDDGGASSAAPSGPSMLLQEQATQDAQGAKIQPDAEHRVLVDADKAPADTQGVIVEARPSQDNRQRIEQLQAQANRIRVDNDLRTAADVAHAQASDRVLREHAIAPAQDAPASPLEAVDAAQAVPAPAGVPEQAALPPEVMVNTDRQAKAVDAKESALMARLRALKSNMSVTENRLTKLNTPESPDA